MKICFFLQRRFAYIGHDLAILLKKYHDVQEFCGYVSLRSSFRFLKEQKDILYSALILDEDVHAQYKKEKLDLAYLERLEKEYGIPNLWPYLAVDRIIMFNQLVREYPWNTPRYTHEEMLRILQVNAKAVIAFLDQEKPDAIVISAIALPGFLLNEIAKKRGIKVLHIITTSVKDKFGVSEQYDALTDTDTIFKKNLAHDHKNAFYAEAKKIIENFRNNPSPYNTQLTPTRQPINRLKQLQFIRPKNFIRSITWFFKLIYQHITTPDRYDYSYIHPYDYLKDRIKRKIRNLIGVDDLYDTFNPEENHAFFGLHYEPEISLLLLAPLFTDQLHVIKHIAKSLPVGYKLYVKEHPYMTPFRPRAYYKELKKIPNVKLINPAMESFGIIKNAKLIFTITGSIGWEGIVLKKPVIVFGNQFYNTMSIIRKCENIADLPRIVNEQLTDFKYSEEELVQFTSALLEDCATLPMLYLWEQETDEKKKMDQLKPLADLIAKKILGRAE